MNVLSVRNLPQALAALLPLVLVATAFAESAPESRENASFHISAICHAGFWVQDIEKSRVFYKTVLGFDEPYTLKRPNGDLFVAFFKVNDRQTINLYPGGEKATDSAGSLYHIGLETDHAAAFHDYLAAHGIAASAVHKTALGDEIFGVKDPDGTAYEITQYEAGDRLSQTAGHDLPPGRIANHLSSVTVWVKNLPASLAFYRDLLHFKEVPQTGKVNGTVLLRLPDGKDTLLLDPGSPKRGTAALHPPARFTLEDARTAHLARSIFVDPDGTRIEVAAPGYSGTPAEKVPPTRSLVYKKVDGRELSLFIFEPKGLTPGGKRPCLVAIHGGGWAGGNPTNMYSYGAWAAELGMVGISVQYRLLRPGSNVTVYDCVKDGRSAMRYVRSHAAELGIDPNRIAVIGSSAGSHVAVSTALFDGMDEPGEDTSVSCMPNAMVLCSSVIDTSLAGYGNAKAGPHWEELSPVLHVHPGLPPTILFHGTGDETTPFIGAQKFYDEMIAAGNRCELIVEPGAPHTYYGKDKALWDKTMKEMRAFLASLGYCSSESAAADRKKTTDYAAALGDHLEPSRFIAYKKIGKVDLKLHVFDPDRPAGPELRPCFVVFHGGGWTSLAPNEVYALAARAAALGWLAICPEYRLSQPGSVSVFDVVKDARSAVRYVRAHANDLGIDPHKIVVAGVSAGGHLAVATALFDEVDEAGEDTSVSCRPDALVLEYAVIDTSKEGYGNAKIGERWRELSPADQVRPGMPPTLMFHGTGDTKTPFIGAQKFHDAMIRAGNRCELVVNEGGPHAYMRRDKELLLDSMRRTEAFLASLGIRPLGLNPDPVYIHGIKVDLRSPPAGLAVRPQLGLLTVDALDGQVVYRTKSRLLETRAVVTPAGDFLLMFAEGEHYANSKGQHLNTMLAFRSSDHGWTWSGPEVPYAIDYNQHGFVPLIPKGTSRIYAFGTQPVPGNYEWRFGQQENAPIGYRFSDDDGRTWSPVHLIRPVNDPDFRGMSVTRMTETDAGTWLIGAHTKDASVKPQINRQYILRSDDKGVTWTLLPGPRPNGWFAAGFNRMDEGRPINLGAGEVLFMARTMEGHLWSGRSLDDGKTWTTPSPTSLVHPDAPPMVFLLSDGHTLIELLHNRTPGMTFVGLDTKKEAAKVRSEIWFSLSKDGGRNWDEPRFLFTSADAPTADHAGWNYQNSYVDLIAQGGVLHFFVPHRWEEAIHMTMPESALADSPELNDLAHRVSSQVL